MGFLKKIFRGVKKVFKKIGRGIKKGFAKFGKFMNKIGIVGQIAMMFILPGIGGALMKGLGTLGATLSASSSLILQGAGAVLNGAMNFATTVGNAFRTVTNGIMEFGKTALNKIPGINIQGAATNFITGPDSALARVKIDASKILDPWKKTIAGKGRTLSDISKTTGVSVEDLGKANVDMTKGVKLENWGDIVATEGTSISTKLTTLPGESAATRSIYGPAGEVAAAPSDAEVLWKKTPPSAAVTTPATPTTPSLLAQEQSAYDKMVADATEKGLIDPKPEVTIPTPESTGFASDFYEEAKAELKSRYDPSTPIKTVQTIQSDIARFQKPEVDTSAGFGGGYIVDVGQYSPEDFQAMNTVVTPFLQQLQKDSGVFGYSAYLDDQVSYNQRMIQENQSRFSVGGGT
jgi:hypothetical protein